MYTQKCNIDNLFTIRQGDAYPIWFELRKDDDTLITNENCNDISISIDRIEKRFSNSTVIFSEGKWGYQLSQRDSYAMHPGIVAVDVKVKFSEQEVIGIKMQPIKVEPTFNKVIL